MLTKIQRWFSKYDWESWVDASIVICAGFATASLTAFIIAVIYYIVVQG